MELILINKDGNTLDLLNNDNYFIMKSCDNLHGIDTDIATIDIPYQDGVQIENVKALPRGISMKFKLIPDIKSSIDFFTNVVKSKQIITLQLTEKNQTIIIKGIATITPYTRMMSACEIQLDIYCGQPYWEDLQQVIGAISMILPKLNFPAGAGQYFTPVGRVFSVVDMNAEKTFDNTGDVAVGMNIKIVAIQSAQNPRISCSSGEQNGNYMQINLTLQANDEIEINTVIGNKYIKINGQTTYNGTPVLSALQFTGNDWLKLETGENTFNVGEFIGGQLVVNNNLYFTISYRRRYE